VPRAARQAQEILELEEDRPRLKKELSWYNDKIVNYLIEILCGEEVVKNQSNQTASPIITNTHLFVLLQKDDNRQQRLLSKQLRKNTNCIVPVHRGNHWACALFFTKNEKTKLSSVIKDLSGHPTPRSKKNPD